MGRDELGAGPAFGSAVDRRTLALAASFGIAATLLLSGFIGYQARAQRGEWQTSDALRESESRLQALVREREQASRDLHDGVLQSLYALGLGLQKTCKVLRRDPGSAEGYGLRNMRTRAAETGGELTLDSQPGRGTCVTVSIPLTPGGKRSTPAARPPSSEVVSHQKNREGEAPAEP